MNDGEKEIHCPHCGLINFVTDVEALKRKEVRTRLHLEAMFKQLDEAEKVIKFYGQGSPIIGYSNGATAKKYINKYIKVGK